MLKLNMYVLLLCMFTRPDLYYFLDTDDDIDLDFDTTLKLERKRLQLQQQLSMLESEEDDKGPLTVERQVIN